MRRLLFILPVFLFACSEQSIFQIPSKLCINQNQTHFIVGDSGHFSLCDIGTKDATWYLDNQEIGHSSNVSIHFKHAGTYSLVLYVGDGDRLDSLETLILVHEKGFVTMNGVMYPLDQVDLIHRAENSLWFSLSAHYGLELQDTSTAVYSGEGVLLHLEYLAIPNPALVAGNYELHLNSMQSSTEDIESMQSHHIYNGITQWSPNYRGGFVSYNEFSGSQIADYQQLQLQVEQININRYRLRIECQYKGRTLEMEYVGDLQWH